MKCNICGSSVAVEIRVVYDNNERLESCDQCGGFTRSWNPDVYFIRPYFDSNIADASDPKTMHGQMIYSKRHKAELLKKLKMREDGDRHHGERTEYRPYGPSRKIFSKGA